ncbi:oxidoreductase [Modestobacter sp. I12A-02628]|uniref:Oxidoreductase n=1 Tax=Goekera deserti TaxID=2497753 RepID=A0A7K3WGV8_9ACTN|nr:PQQ-dependent sugar dehydrogenase [Goekera deserti]MPQ97337.1 oxidoreductase [Goekera deserti]NDI50150.1 oxidoreductase [Goekera deserti]NEL55718.1 oxidoreductase [Goekera deserti]
MSRPTTRRAAWVSAALLGSVLLAGCGSDGYEPSGPWRAVPEGEPPVVAPPSQQPPGQAPTDPADPADPGDPAAGDPNVVATDLAVPTGLVVLPDGSAIVGERETGRLLQVFPDRSPARELMTVPVDTAGDGGLLGLALSPTYTEDGLLYAYLSTATDNQVVRFPLGGTPNPVFTGIPRGETHNGGGLVFAPDGTLYVGTGDTGNPALAQDPASLAGKVLAIDGFGQPTVGGDPVFTRGHSDVTALCLGADAAVFATDDSAQGLDELDRLVPGGDYGWPAESPTTADPVTTVAAADGGLGGCAVTAGTVFLGARDGKRVHIVTLDGNGVPTGEPADVLGDRYGRLRTVVVDAQGGLWVTTSNRDGAGTPAADDDKVLRIVAPTSSGDSPL